MDYSSVRNAADDATETVSVNHRALITRTLTKYPVDYALYRELLQNSADASADDVEIIFHAKTALPTDQIHAIQTHPVDRLTVRNNGQYFEQDDWNRLREIAKGNPNESKIGAFGVGFYSVFELTEEPLVHSGTQVMSFHYIGDQLHYKSQNVPTSDGWTIIDLPYKQVGTLPNLPQFTAFLTKSFMLVPLAKITVKMDDLMLFEIEKVTCPAADLAIPSFINRTSPDKTLYLKSMEIESQQVKITYRNVTQISTSKSAVLNLGRKWFSSLVTSSSDPAELTKATCFLRKVTAKVQVSVSRSFANEMKATVMKPPPSIAVVALLTFNREEQELSQVKAPLLNYMFPQEMDDAKIFIGFPTKQTPGFKSHLAMNQLIPTMERTAIDMANKFVNTWNGNMLTMAGIVARVVYEYEMTQLAISTGNNKTSEDAQSQLIQSVSHIMSRFHIGRSGPDTIVGEKIATGFWKCSSELSVLSQHGITKTSQVKYAEGGNVSFVRNIPTLSVDLSDDDAKKFLQCPISLGYVKKLSVNDVIQELETRSLSYKDFKEFMEWGSSEISLDAFRKCISVAVVGDIALDQIVSYQSLLILDQSFPIPRSCLPHELAKDLTPAQLQAAGWTPLDIVPTWLSYVIEQSKSEDIAKNISLNPEFANKVLNKLDSLYSKDKTMVYEMLKNVDCIPTIDHGVKCPHEVYFNKIDLFPDLPVISPHISASKGFLSNLGVRETVNMEVVMKNLDGNLHSALKWSSGDVIAYIQKNRTALKRSDWQVLQTTAFLKSLAADGHYRASQLYAPHPALITLGFRTLLWEGSWSDDSSDAKLLYDMGLQRYPSLHDLFRKGSTSDVNAKSAIGFYLNAQSKGWYSASECGSITEYAVIPCSTEKGETTLFAAPARCYSDPDVRMFGFPAIADSLVDQAANLGLKRKPATSALARRLIENPPDTLEKADKCFAYLAYSVKDLTKAEIKELSMAAIIPTDTKGVHIAPKDAYFETESVSMEDFEVREDLKYMREFFSFVAVTPAAQVFLRTIGARSSPTILDRAWVLLEHTSEIRNEAQRISGGINAYIGILLRLANGYNQLQKDPQLIARMKRTEFLVAEMVSTAANKPSHEKSSILVMPTNPSLVLADDVILYNSFKEHVLTCPPRDLLEEFYQRLGVKKLSELIKEEYSCQGLYDNPSESEDLKNRIVERVALFLDGVSPYQRKNGREFDINKLKVQLVRKLQKTLTFKKGLWDDVVVNPSVSAMLDPKLFVMYITPNNFDWFDVSQCLIKVLLDRPTPDSVLVLETQLSNDLRSLERKGYDVGRIIEKKRIEQEERVMKEKEMRRLQEKEEAKKHKFDKDAELRAPKAPVKTAPTVEESTTKEVFHDAKEHPHSHVPTSESSPPPPYSPGTNQTDSNDEQSLLKTGLKGSLKSLWKRGSSSSGGLNPTGGSSSSGSNNGMPGTNGVGSVPGGQTSYNDEINNLNRGKQRLQPFTRTSIKTPQRVELPSKTPSLDQQCDVIPAQDLVYSNTLSNSINCFMRNGEQKFTPELVKQAEQLGSLLQTLASVYEIPLASMHIFYDGNSRTIAFNLNGSLFFNVHYHMRPLYTGNLSSGDTVRRAVEFWYIVTAHELAHNFVGSHNAQHSSMLERYAYTHMERLVDAVKRL